MNCEHLRTSVLKADFGPHKAKKICIDCLLFLQWEKLPQEVLSPFESDDPRKSFFPKPLDNLQKVDALLRCPLSISEKDFVTSGKKWEKWTKKQEDWFNRIFTKWYPEGLPNVVKADYSVKLNLDEVPF